MDNNVMEPAWRNVNIIALGSLLNACDVWIKAETRV
jgi:hypothetical protein